MNKWSSQVGKGHGFGGRAAIAVYSAGADSGAHLYRGWTRFGTSCNGCNGLHHFRWESKVRRCLRLWAQAVRSGAWECAVLRCPNGPLACMWCVTFRWVGLGRLSECRPAGAFHQVSQNIYLSNEGLLDMHFCTAGENVQHEEIASHNLPVRLIFFSSRELFWFGKPSLAIEMIASRFS